ncbi:MAG: CocE/NonD family hydrolase, partial [Vicinamibacteria bacterium]|nr:CocE/NonD family hydrolase [Vicinamibacteria bacterium]
MFMTLTRITLGAACLILAPLQVRAQEAPAPNPVREKYTKHEFKVKMRDGAFLFTSIYTPKDTTRVYPVMMQRTPYSVSPYGIDNYRTALGPSPAFQKEGFIFVYQDVRGRYMSDGAFLETTPHKPVKRSPVDVDESSDTFDTVEWILKNVKGHNGKVGIWGISYPGFYA